MQQNSTRQCLEEGDLAYQEQILPGVSRTFALTIPQLPAELSQVVTNAYLLCRLADTIEDDVELSSDQKSEFHRRFLSVVKGGESPEPFALALEPLLSARTLPQERELVANTHRVVRVTHRFSVTQRDAMLRCLTIMCNGMPGFQRNKSLRGLRNLRELDDYCYVVAGIVGEMLTELFCDYSPEVARRRDTLMRSAVYFGQGLQMTNILKDIWEDRRADTCWLPRSVFSDAGFDLEQLNERRDDTAFVTGLTELIGIAHAHLREALGYIQLIPRREVGIRRFCLWAVGLALLTLQNIHRNPKFGSGNEVKVSRTTVKATVLTCNVALYSNRLLQTLFSAAARGLPLSDAPFGAYQRYAA